METILNDEKTYEKTMRPPFKKVEHQLNKLLDLKNHDKLDETTYQRLRSTDGTPPTFRGSIKIRQPTETHHYLYKLYPI